ncbi:phage tail protein [Burkholderia cepacia]|uniref:phage tail fiber protein n=1 Tax=Burkholderia cepacia TaxID=292 RepID=UPI000A40DF0D|nr:phage tail protein [Burkholderia cepacia]
MAGNLIYITDAGRAALVAPGNTGTTARQVTQIGLATAPFAYKPDMAALPSELKRITTFGGDTVAKDTIHIVIQDDSVDQYKLYGFGLYLDNGVLFGVYVQNDPILEKAPASMLLLAADTVFASIDVSKLVFGSTSFLNPPATTERKGVVELATQAEVDDGSDDTRAVTPKTAASRYAPLVRPQLTGPVSITSTSTDQDAQLTVAGASGALNREAKIRFHGTFAAGTADTNKRFIASMRAGYDAGTWGREYLDFWINRAPNDSNSDANQVRAMRITYGGRIVVGNRNDDTANAFQVGGNGAFSGGVSSGGLDAGGANFRLMNSKDVLLRNDGSNFYVLLSNGSGYGASWNDFRPITVNVATGVLSLDDTGAGTYVGGRLNVKGDLNVSNGGNEGHVLLGPSGGYFFASATKAGFYLPSADAMFAFDFATKNLFVGNGEVWHSRNLPNPAQTTGITMSGQILAAEGTVSRPGYSFVNDGAPDTGFFHISDGVFAVTNNGRETMRFLAVDGSYQNNRVLIGQPADDGSMLQVAGNASTRGLHRFGNGTTTAWVNSDAAWGYFRSNGNVSVGSEGATGTLQLIAGKAEVARFFPGGRMTLGGLADDGSTALRGAGNARFTGELQSTSPNGLRIAYGDFGVFLRADGANAFLMQTAAKDQYGAGNAFRPFQWGLNDGVVAIDGTGAGANFGGAVNVAKGLSAGGSVKGVSSVGALIASNGGGTSQTSLLLRREGGAVDQKQWEVLHGGDGAFTIRTVNDAYSSSKDVLYVTRGAGIAAGNMGLMPNGGRVLIGGAADDGSILNAEGLIRGRGYAVDGGSSWATIYFKNGAKTRFAVGKTDTDDFAVTAWADDGVGQSRVLDISRGNQVVSFMKRPSFAGATPWDSMNLTPLDKNVGGTMQAALYVQSYGGSKNGFEIGNGDGAAYDKHNFAMFGWNGMGMKAYDGSVNGYYDFRAGKWDVKGGFYVNGARVWDQNTFDPNAKVNRGGDTMTGRLTLAKDGWDADIGMRAADGWVTFLRARRGGGLELINSAYNNVPAFFEDNGTLHIGGSTYQGNGDIWMQWAGKYLSALFGGSLDLAFNRSGNGFWRHPSGFIIQWGYVGGDMGEGAPGAITFPVRFPGAIVSLNATGCNTSATIQSDEWVQAVWWNNDQWQPFVQSSGSGRINGFFWTAMGW